MPNNYAANVPQNPSANQINMGAAPGRSMMQSKTAYGFTGGLQNAAQRGSSLVMMAGNADVTAETSNDDKEENLLTKERPRMRSTRKNSNLLMRTSCYSLLFVPVLWSNGREKVLTMLMVILDLEKWQITQFMRLELHIHS